VVGDSRFEWVGRSPLDPRTLLDWKIGRGPALACASGPTAPAKSRTLPRSVSSDRATRPHEPGNPPADSANATPPNLRSRVAANPRPATPAIRRTRERANPDPANSRTGEPANPRNRYRGISAALPISPLSAGASFVLVSARSSIIPGSSISARMWDRIPGPRPGRREGSKLLQTECEQC
jgi:hypothetical protein